MTRAQFLYVENVNRGIVWFAKQNKQYSFYFGRIV